MQLMLYIKQTGQLKYVMKDLTIFEADKFKLSFAWYDLWIGVYIDTNKRKLYICPLPTILLTLRY